MERNVSTSGVSIYFEAYLYNASSYANTQWQLPPLHWGSSQRRPSTATEDEDEDSPSDSQTPEKVKKPKKVYCYVSPKVRLARLFPSCTWFIAIMCGCVINWLPGTISLWSLAIITVVRDCVLCYETAGVLFQAYIGDKIVQDFLDYCSANQRTDLWLRFMVAAGLSAKMELTIVQVLSDWFIFLKYVTLHCFCSFTSKQFSVKEFYLKIIPWRLFTFRVCPGTKVCW